MVNYLLLGKDVHWNDSTNLNNELYQIGCAHKIHSFNETDDGRYFNCLFKVQVVLELFKELIVVF